MYFMQVVDYSGCRTTEDILEESTKLITLIDLCGHPKYLKTTVFGLTGSYPDFAMLVVSATGGIGRTVKFFKLCTSSNAVSSSP